MKRTIAILFIIAFCTGLLSALVHYEFILWQGQKQIYTESLLPHTCKNLSIWYIKNNEWKEEKVALAWQHTQEAIELVANQWLDILLQEKCLTKKIGLQSTLLDIHEQCAYISFEQSLFERQHSTEQKIEIIASLCKTIDTLSLGIHNCFFLVNHQPMQDYHLDFSFPWPLHYYIDLFSIHT